MFIKIIVLFIIFFASLPVHSVKCKKLYKKYLIIFHLVLCVQLIYFWKLFVISFVLFLQKLLVLLYILSLLCTHVFFTRNFVKYDKTLDALLSSLKLFNGTRARLLVIFYCWIMLIFRLTCVIYNYRKFKIFPRIIMFLSNIYIQRFEFLLIACNCICGEWKNQFKLLNKKMKTDRNVLVHLKTYRSLIQKINDFNRIFGVSLACAVVSIILLILCIISLKVFSIDPINKMETKFSPKLSYVFPFLAYLIRLAIIGEQLSTETKKTVAICHNNALNINKLAFISGNSNKLQKQYLDFAKEAHERNNKLSAAGYFSIDNSMILFIITNVCTYLIVICQLIAVHS
ncbi:hypothetical protein ABEB36_003636 [Hypothenemus hampei]|uniref:Gustatory receptor n=1 Tax=Hypothenemus hampei TaxID=57062 RepID=A0ABD1F9X0_HYPHA